MVSGRTAFRSRVGRLGPEELEASRVPQLERSLCDFLVERKGRILTAQHSHGLISIAVDVGRVLATELAGLDAPLEELRARTSTCERELAILREALGRIEQDGPRRIFDARPPA